MLNSEPRPSASDDLREAVESMVGERSSLGPPAHWSPALKAAVDFVLTMPQPACLCWGQDARLIYNAPYRTILGHRHPTALGQPLTEVWREFSDDLAPRIARTLQGEPQVWDDAPFDISDRDERLRRAWFTATWTPIRIETGDVGGFLIVATETTARRRAELELRDSQDRDAFLLELSDAMRPLGDAAEIQMVAAAALGARLGADRVGYAEDLGDDEIAVTRNYTRGVMGIEGRYRYDDYGPELLRAFRRGETIVRDDVANDSSLSADEKAAHVKLQIGSTANVPLLKDGKLRAVLFAHYKTAHQFAEGELELMRDVAERTWAEVMRARAEQETRHSEERYRTLFSSMDEGYCIIQMLYDESGVAQDWRFIEVNRAFELHNGLVGAQGRTIREMAPGIERKWIDTYNRVAETGESLRFQEKSGALQDRFFDLYAFRVGAPADRKVAVLFTNITEAKRLAERQEVLLAELQHRVRNTMTMIRTISERTVRSSSTLEEFATAWAGRLAALSRVQALLTQSAALGVELSSLLEEELAAHENQFHIEGPRLTLPPKAAEVLTLAVHELATNALKHGALATSDGRVEASWDVTARGDQQWITFNWREFLPSPLSSPSPCKNGFGRELIERRIPYDLHGKSTLNLGPWGATCVLEFPLAPSASVLETGIPDRTTLFDDKASTGPGQPLADERVMIVEDDFLLADDLRRKLALTGAQILGPFPTEGAALASFAQRLPTLAVLDVNLGVGPSFDLARALIGRSIPILFLTGYDDYVFPDDLTGISRLQKPAEIGQVVSALSNLSRS